MHDPNDSAQDASPPTAVDEQWVRRLGKQWFAEAQAQSERDVREFACWNRDRLKWTRGGGASGSWSDFFGGDGGNSGGCGGDGGGGD
jgi:type II secretory pathway pseudopilin PulG